MKKYIKPQSCIEMMTPVISFMDNGSKPGLNGPGGDGNQLGNQGFFDDMEDSYPPKDKGLWDDAYNDK